MMHKNSSKMQKYYEAWVIRRINDKKSLCSYFKGHKCVPTHNETCRSCFLKDTVVT
jgi:hypothetical protein